ncbi:MULTISPECIES: HNH endonuclease [unclassified Nostoc]|uniref:HNH endonuclease n=1 Tax=unclassified Nostoc TaxID=2593658 RepID=UPI0025CCBE1B|nr:MULTISPECIES: HNH endonuclease [unclassified Nostoc]
MSFRSKISESIQKQVRQRAKYLCEYCHASEQWQYVQFTVDHIMPLSLGGTDNLENLALACFHCNRRKTNRLTATDHQSGEEVLLLNPRQHIWSEHFIWSADGLLIGSIHFWKKHRAIGNRGYTNEVRLRGLSETREGGFSLYSPRLLV